MISIPTILLAEDDKTVRDIVITVLQKQGYQVFPAMTGKRMIEVLDSSSVDLILLDLVLPDADGLDLIKDIRIRTNVPIIILSGKTNVADKVAGFDRGVDDYIEKPFHPSELCARVGANIRRYQSFKSNDNSPIKDAKYANQLRFCQWVLNREKQVLFDEQGTPQVLTRQEYRLLEALTVYAPQIMSRHELGIILSDTFENVNGGDRAVDISVTRLRKKLGDDAHNPHIIRTCRGEGYQMICDVHIEA